MALIARRDGWLLPVGLMVLGVGNQGCEVAPPQLILCGNGLVESNEDCDDGNRTATADSCDENCEDRDECAADLDDCDAVGGVCANLPDGQGFVCSCAAGYSGDGRVCADIDECSLSIDGCAPNATCINIPGTYTCRCENGFDDAGTRCIDQDQCQSASDCGAFGDCVQTGAVRLCECDQGYILRAGTCQNLDECALGIDRCSTAPAVRCADTQGSYRCGACPAGFTDVRADGTQCSGESPTPLGDRVVAVAVTGTEFACALLADSRVACWGDHSLPDARSLAPAEDLAVRLVDLALGDRTVCGMTKAATVRCWSWDPQFGDAAPPRDLTWLALAVGDEGTCGIDVAGRVACFGNLATSAISNADETFVQLHVEGQTVIGLTVDGTMVCAGPQCPPFLDAAPALAKFSARGQRVCGVQLADGTLWCAQDIELTEGFAQGPVAEVCVGGDFVCALSPDFSTNKLVPQCDGGLVVAPAPIQAMFSLACGEHVACGITASGLKVNCWGSPDPTGLTQVPPAVR